MPARESDNCCLGADLWLNSHFEPYRPPPAPGAKRQRLCNQHAVAPKDGSYQHTHGNSPPDIAPPPVADANISSSARVGQSPELARERDPPSVACSRTGPNRGNLNLNLARLSRNNSSGHALNAPPSSSPPGFRGDIPGPVGGGGGREVFQGGGSRTRPCSSALRGRDQYSDYTRQGSGRRQNLASVQVEVFAHADQRQHHPQPDEQRPDQPRWAVTGNRTRGREDRQYRAGVGEAVKPVGANPPPEGFFDRDCSQGHFLRGISDGMFHGRWRREPQVPERGASRTRNRQEPGGAAGSNGGRGGLFRAPKIASSIPSNHRQQYTPTARGPPPTRSPPLRATSRQLPLEGNYLHHGNGDREGLVGERERRLKRRPFQPSEEEPGDTSNRSRHAAPPVWSVEEVGSEAGTRAAFGSARVSVPVAMTIDTHYTDRRRTDDYQSDRRQQSSIYSRHLDTSCVLDNHRADPSNHPDTKRLANNDRYSISSSNIRRYVDGSTDDYNRPFDDNGNRAGDTTNHPHNQAYCVDNHSRQTSRRYNVESRSGKRGRWHHQGEDPEREQRRFEAGTPRYPPRLAGRVIASNESSGWVQGKFDAYGLTAQSPTH